MPYPAMPLTGSAGNDDDDVGGDGDFSNDDGISISEDHGHEANDGRLILWC